MIGHLHDNKLKTDKRSLTIHIRSGDIFKPRSIHSKYGQPPLSYYIFCINHFSPDSVNLIIQDYLNPTIKSLILFLKSNKIDFKIFDTGDLLLDASIVINSTHIVCGNGTFIPGILLGSSSINTLYLFDIDDSFIDCWSLYRVPFLHNVTDKEGLYRDTIMSNNWLLSRFQLWLMSNYPISNLHIR